MAFLSGGSAESLLLCLHDGTLEGVASRDPVAESQISRGNAVDSTRVLPRRGIARSGDSGKKRGKRNLRASGVVSTPVLFNKEAQ